MAAQNTPKRVEKKRRPKKKKSRREVSSSSESDDSEQEQLAKDGGKFGSSSAPEPVPEPSKKTKKKAKSKSSADAANDVSMVDADSTPVTAASATKQGQGDFSAMYLRRIAAELADDLDKVREAQDFKANSVPMLIHALRQGESLFSVEEKRRVVAAANQ